MIFVTVGTHEQPFNRLIQAIDMLKETGVIDDEVIIQRGYSTYEPKHCKYYDFLSYDDMDKYVKVARIVITHGGPASFIAPLSVGKTPIVVPRQKKFDEHINDHQLDFCNELKRRKLLSFVINDIDELKESIASYQNSTNKLNFNNNKFIEKFNFELKKLFI